MLNESFFASRSTIELSLGRRRRRLIDVLVDDLISIQEEDCYSSGKQYRDCATMQEYNASVEFYLAPLLVESNSDDLANHRIEDRIARAQSIEKFILFIIT